MAPILRPVVEARAPQRQETADGNGIFTLQISFEVLKRVAGFVLGQDSGEAVIEENFRFACHGLFLRVLIADGGQGVAEEVEDNIDLVHAKRRLAALQFADEADADPGPVGEVLLSHLERLALPAHKFRDWLIHFYTRTVIFSIVRV